MLENYYSQPKTIERLRQSWISESVEKYVTWMHDNGHAVKTIVRRVPILVHFGQYAKDQGAKRLEDLPTYIDDFACHYEQQSRCCRTKARQRSLQAEVRSCVSQMLSMVSNYERPPKIRCNPHPSFAFVDQFFVYLREERGLKNPTLRGYYHSLGIFQSYLDRIGIADISDLSAPILSSFVIDSKERLGKPSLELVLGAMRVLLRYLYREKLIKRDLSTTIEMPRTYALSKLPRSISWEQVRSMLEVVDLRTPVGRRDYAILLLFVTYGLRSREVARLTLDDVDWKNERIRVRERKGGHETTYPLSSAVANAILEYLRHDRPKSNERLIFFNMKAPIRPMSAQSISYRPTCYMRAAGIDVPRCGSHTLRHTCVQRLIDAQLSLKLIGDYIGHASAESTRIYSKVDFKSLRELALGVGEDLV